MPAEKFYYTGQVENDDRGPDLTVAWGDGSVYINGTEIATAQDVSGLNRLIRSLRRARDHVLDH